MRLKKGCSYGKLSSRGKVWGKHRCTAGKGGERGKSNICKFTTNLFTLCSKPVSGTVTTVLMQIKEKDIEMTAYVNLHESSCSRACGKEMVRQCRQLSFNYEERHHSLI